MEYPIYAGQAQLGLHHTACHSWAAAGRTGDPLHKYLHKQLKHTPKMKSKSSSDRNLQSGHFLNLPIYSL